MDLGPDIQKLSSVLGVLRRVNPEWLAAIDQLLRELATTHSDGPMARLVSVHASHALGTLYNCLVRHEWELIPRLLSALRTDVLKLQLYAPDPPNRG